MSYSHFFTYDDKWKALATEFPELNYEAGWCWFACLCMLLHSISIRSKQTLFETAREFATRLSPPDIESLLDLQKTMMLVRPEASGQTQSLIDYPCSFHTGIKAVLYMLPTLKINTWMLKLGQDPCILADFILELCTSGYNLMLNCDVRATSNDRNGDGHVVYFDSSNGAKDQQFALSDSNYPDPLMFNRPEFESWLIEDTPYTKNRSIRFAGIVYGFK